jgi:hypothetical protein
MRATYWVLGVAMVTLHCGCKPEVSVETPDVRKAAAELRQGLEHMDPMGLKKLLDKSAELRETVDYLRGRMNLLPTASGAIETEGSAVQFAIPLYSGEFKVTGWIDSPENWFWRDKVFNACGVLLGFDFRKTLAAGLAPPLRDAYLNGDPDLKTSSAANVANAGSEHQFQEFLHKSVCARRPDASIVDLNQELGAGSLHKLVIVVTPTKVDAGGKWLLRGSVFVRRESSVVVLKEFDLGSDLAPGAKIGESLPPVEILLMVNQPAAKGKAESKRGRG